MKTLYLVRHAKSDHVGNLLDIDRPLNTRGYDDAHFMSKLMRKNKFVPDVIISSPAIRAITSALIFCRNFNLDPQKIILNTNLYETSVKDYTRIIEETDNQFKKIMLFAHNPTISEFANSLIPVFNENIPTCGIIGIKSSVIEWKTFTKTKNELFLFDYPKKHINKS
jgi:phosphohistidine phosphatase